MVASPSYSPNGEEVQKTPKVDAFDKRTPTSDMKGLELWTEDIRIQRWNLYLTVFTSEL